MLSSRWSRGADGFIVTGRCVVFLGWLVRRGWRRVPQRLLRDHDTQRGKPRGRRQRRPHPRRRRQLGLRHLSDGARVEGDSTPEGHDSALLKPAHLVHAPMDRRRLGLALVSKIRQDDDDDQKWNGGDLQEGDGASVFKEERISDALPA